MAETVGKGIVEVEADTKGLGADIAKKVDSEKGVISKTFSGVGSAMGKAFKAAAVAGAAGVVAAAAFAGQAISAASDLSESMSKTQAVFDDAAPVVVEWAENAAEAFGQSKQQALEAAASYGNLFQAFGVHQRPAREMSQSLTELAADLASFNNTSIDEALLALRSGLSGETEPLKRFGIAINDARLKEEALALGLIKSTKEALDPAAKAQAAYALIMKDTTLAQGDFARTSDGLANKQRILSAKFADVKASIGRVLLPAFLAVVSVIADKVLPTVEKMWHGLVEAFKGEGITSNGIVGVAERVGVALRAVVEWVKRNWPTIKEIFVDVMRAVGDALIRARDILFETFEVIRNVITWIADNEAVFYGIATVIAGVLVAALVSWTTATWAQVTALWAQAGAFVAAHAPIIATIAILAALVAGVIYAYQNWGWFREAVDSVASFMRDTLWPTLQSVFGWLRDNVPPAIAAVVAAFQATWAFISDKIIPIVREVVEKHLAALKVAFDVIKTVIIDVVIPALQGLWSFITDKVIPIVASIATKIGEVAATVGTKVGEIVGFVLGIPGRIASTVSTLWFGFENGVAAARTWARERFDEVVGFVTGMPGRIASAAVGMWDGIKNAFKSAVNWIIRAWNGLEFKIPGFDPPGPGPSFGGVTIGVPKIPELAKGGRVKARHPYIVGEEGWEPFIPDTSGYIVNHQEAIAALSGGGWPDEVTLVVEGQPLTAIVMRREQELVGALAAGVR